MASKSQLDKSTESIEDVARAANQLEAHTEAKPILVGLTDDELRKLSREKLSAALQCIDPATQAELTRKLCAELMDRLDGKPAQSMQLDATLRSVVVNATIRFADTPQHLVIENDQEIKSI